MEEGAKYGLELNWDKSVVINIQTDLMQPSGNEIRRIDRVVDLGNILVCLCKSRIIQTIWRSERQFQDLGRLLETYEYQNGDENPN